jgi:hypothetical protein
MKKIVAIILLLSIGFMMGCTFNPHETTRSNYDTLKYATGFSVQTEGNIHYVSINSPYPGAKEKYQYCWCHIQKQYLSIAIL